MLSEFCSRGSLWQVNIGIMYDNHQIQALFVKINIEFYFKNFALNGPY
jgi:hypothetical protein